MADLRPFAGFAHSFVVALGVEADLVVTSAN